jgi:hypothetical protein
MNFELAVQPYVDYASTRTSRRVAVPNNSIVCGGSQHEYDYVGSDVSVKVVYRSIGCDKNAYVTASYTASQTVPTSVDFVAALDLRTDLMLPFNHDQRLVLLYDIGSAIKRSMPFGKLVDLYGAGGNRARAASSRGCRASCPQSWSTCTRTRSTRAR